MRTKFFVLALILVGLNSLKAQSPTILWQKCLGGTEIDSATSIKKMPDGSIIIAGMTKSNNGDVTNYHGNTDAFIIKLDSLGNKVWAKCFGGSNYDIATGIDITADNGIILCGYTSSNDGDVTTAFSNVWNNAWLFKLDENGNLLFSKTFGGSNDDKFKSIKCINNNIYVFGITKSVDGDLTALIPPATGLDTYYWSVWMLKINHLGDIISQNFEHKYFQGGAHGIQLLNLESSLNSTLLYNYYTSDRTGTGSFSYATRKAIIDTNLNITNSLSSMAFQPTTFQLTNTDFIDFGEPVFMPPFGASYFGIRKFLNQSLYYNYWQKYYYTNRTDELKKAISINNKYLIAGNTNGDSCSNCVGVSNSYNHNGNLKKDIWVVIVDTGGTIMNQKFIGGSDNDLVADLLPTSESGFIILGTTYSNNGDVSGYKGGGDIWVVKLNSISSSLPLKLISFIAQNKNKGVLLSWLTKNEVNVSHINVQRSNNAREFITIGKVNATCCNYNYNDPLADIQLATNFYYRLEIIDKDGSKTYSEIKNVELRDVNIGIKVYPNPSTSTVSIECDGAKELIIIDYWGRTIRQFNNVTQPQIINCKQLNKGNYIVKAVMNNGEIKTKKLIIE